MNMNPNRFPCVSKPATALRLKRLREAAHLPITAVTKAANVSKTTVYNWEDGTKNILPTLDHLCVLSGLYSVTLDDLIVITGLRLYEAPASDVRLNRFLPCHLLKAETALRLNRLREAARLPVREVAEAAQVSNTTVYSWEDGTDNGLPTLDHLCVLSVLYRTSLDDLVVMTGTGAAAA